MNEENCVKIGVFVLAPLGLWTLVLVANLYDEHRSCGCLVELMLLAFTSGLLVVIGLCMRAGDRLLHRQRNRLTPMDKLLMAGGLFFLLFDASAIPAMIAHSNQCKQFKPTWILNVDWFVLAVLLLFSVPMIFVLIATACEAAEFARSSNEFARKIREIALRVADKSPLDTEFLHRFRDNLDFIGPRLSDPDQKNLDLVKQMTSQTMALTMTADQLQAFSGFEHERSVCAACNLLLKPGKPIIFTPCCLLPVHHYCFGKMNSCLFCLEGKQRSSFLAAFITRLQPNRIPQVTLQEVLVK